MKPELFGEKPCQWHDLEGRRGKWTLGSHVVGFLTVEGTVECSTLPLERFYFDSLEQMEHALLVAKLRGDAL